MGITKDILETEVRFTSNQAMADLKKMESETASLRRENDRLAVTKAKLEALGKKESEEYKKIVALMKQNGATIKENKSSMEALRKTVGLSAMSMTDLRKRANGLTQQLNNMSKAADPKEYARLEKELGLVHKQMASLQTGTSRTSSFMKAFGAILPALGVGVVVGALTGFVSKMIAVRAEFEKYEAVLRNSLGSAREARSEMAMLKDFAAKTPFQLEQLTGAYVKLVNQGYKPTREELRKLGDLSSSTGKEFDQLVEAILDAQTGEFERLKEFGIKASKQGDVIRFTFKGVTTEVNNNASAIRAYILSLGDAEGVSGSMAAISGTLGGRISNMKDAWSSFLNTVGSRTSGIFSTAVYWITKTVDALGWMSTSLAQLRQEAADERFNDQLKEELAQTEELAQKIAARGISQEEAMKRAVKLQSENMKATIQTYREEMSKADITTARKAYLEKQVTFLDEQLKAYTEHYGKVLTSKSTQTAPQDPEKAYKKEIDVLKEYFTGRQNLLKEGYRQGITSEAEYAAALLALEFDAAEARLRIAKKYNQDVAEAGSELLDLHLKIKKDQVDLLNRMTQDLLKDLDDSDKKIKEDLANRLQGNIDAWLNEDQGFDLNTGDQRSLDWQKNSYDGQVALHQSYLDQKKEDEIAYNQAIAKLDQEQFSKKMDLIGTWAESTRGILDTVSSFQEAAMNRELAAAGDNQKKREEIEKKYNQKKQKWAITQTIIDGIIEVAKIWKSAADLGPAGVAYGIIQSAVAVGRTAGQVAALSSQQFYKGGYTGPGNWDAPVGVVHAEEFVANRHAVRNPAVRQFLDVFDLAQRSGQVASLNTTAILRAVESRRGGYASGGYTPSEIPVPPQTVVVPTDPEMKALLARLTLQLDQGIRSHLVYSEWETMNREVNEIRSKVRIGGS